VKGESTTTLGGGKVLSEKSVGLKRLGVENAQIRFPEEPLSRFHLDSDIPRYLPAGGFKVGTRKNKVSGTHHPTSPKGCNNLPDLSIRKKGLSQTTGRPCKVPTRPMEEAKSLTFKLA